MSARSFTRMVQVSCTRMGTIKSRTPMVDGMMNMSFKRVSFFIRFPFEVPCGGGILIRALQHPSFAAADAACSCGC